MDENNVTLLGLLDLSTAFDTVDHDILLHRLNLSFGISGPVLKWLESFVRGRSQTVVLNGELAPTTQLQYGVSLGSVLGPLLFILYTADICEIAKSHRVGYHAARICRRPTVTCSFYLVTSPLPSAGLSKFR